VLHAALRGEYPPDDGRVDVVAPWSPGVEAVVSFTAHAFVATVLSASVLTAAGVDASEGAYCAGVVTALTGADGAADSLDVVLLAAGTGWTRLPERSGLAAHPRVLHARRWRQDVHVHGDRRGLVTVSRGLGGVAELSFEVAPEFRGAGVGRELLTEARGLIAEGEPVVALVAPGNARSLRAALAAGFVPVGAAQLIHPGPSRPAA
jgi:GNAT superfamily N-acetyltransferase